MGYHEEYDSELIGRLIRLMNSDDLRYSDAMEEPGWYEVSFCAAAVLGGEALGGALVDTGKYDLGNPDKMPIGLRMGMKLVNRDAWFGLIADRLAELSRAAGEGNGQRRAGQRGQDPGGERTARPGMLRRHRRRADVTGRGG